MSKIKGNQKHLTLSDRINIEKGLNNGDSFAEIARKIHKDPTTISKEVRKRSKVKEFNGFGNIPCQANADKHSPCKLKKYLWQQKLHDHLQELQDLQMQRCLQII